MTPVPVLIVGAGPTGLVLALWLTRVGIEVRIIDKAAEPGTTSRALAVQSRTLELYRQLGIAAAVIPHGVEITKVNLWIKGSRAASVPIGRIGEGMSPYPFVLILAQDVHERLLIDRLAALGVHVERNTELTALVQDEQGVRATLRLPDGSESVCEAAYVAGCDGASSTVRDQLRIGFPGGTYSGLFYVADVEAAAGPTTNHELHADLEEADFAIVFPLKGEGRIRLVGIVRPQGVPEHFPAHDAHEKLTFDDVKGRAIESLRLDIRRVNWFSTYRVHHRVAERFRDKRVFLLGDAAHIHSPVGGQGMNTGIGDAVNLAWKLAAVVTNRAPENLLATYEPERIAFARRLVDTTDRVFTVVTKRGAIARFVRTQLVPAVFPVLLRLIAVRRFAFRTLSQTGVSYRHSALSEGSAGLVCGGDRLPWVETGPGQDNFASLASLAWQAHVYGDIPHGLADVCAEQGLPLDRFEWDPRMRRAGLERNALYLVRPDGYIALADARPEPARIRRYLESRGLAFGTKA